jgi:hypothetical protein
LVNPGDDNPIRQFVAAWQAAATVAAEWVERTAAVTTESFHKLTADPAVRALLERWRSATAWVARECECPCANAHPDDIGVCDKRAVITRRLSLGINGLVDVPLCAPCAVAQGVAEMRR